MQPQPLEAFSIFCYVHFKKLNGNINVPAQGSGIAAACCVECPHSGQYLVSSSECGVRVMLVINLPQHSNLQLLYVSTLWANFKVYVLR